MSEKVMTHSHDTASVTNFGFWVYIMTDCVLFASLFATYAVLHNNTFGGASGHDLYNLPNILLETFILLTSSFTSGLAMLAAHKNAKNQVLGWFAITFILGLAFLAMELTEFSKLIHDGHSFITNGFLSSYFTLVGTHGLHILFGLIWMAVLMIQVAKRGTPPKTLTRLSLLSMFWHFLDIIWIFIFTLVYLMAAR